MVLTHPALEAWHRDAVRKATGEYGIGVVFVPLFETGAEHGDEVDGRGGDGLPVLRRLDPRMVSEFTSFDALGAAAGAVERGKKLRYGEGREGSLEEEMVLEVDVRGSVEEIIEEVVRGVRDVMFA
ncbi:hypothetical protein MMC19_002362 [Ptychographa xylographoides]|nr:hypothetical protein [Ptychographa xylographoides]